MCRVLVTGASGFVGRSLCCSLLEKGYIVQGLFRTKDKFTECRCCTEHFAVGEINAKTNWTDALNRVDTVIHLASRVHFIQDTYVNPLDEYKRINTDGTKRLAEMAVKARVRRMIFISTIKVNGEQTIYQPFTEDDLPHPQDPYAVSKWEAELALKQISTGTGLEIVILRPPLVYGSGVKANFLRLLQLVDRGFFLPIGSVDNHRSIIYLENLIDAIINCIDKTEAAGQTFLVSDEQDISTPDLIRMIASAMGKRPKLLPFPPTLLKVIGRFSGKNAEMARLTGSLCIDSSKIRKVLNWKPPFTMEEGIRETVKWYKDS
ncbi:MAG: hypothetical protein A3K22_06445, partial [Deltaproteobacteria bacterium RBG_16_42_7]